MTVNEAYLEAPGANITLDYILEMTPRHHDTFPSTPYTFPGHICPFPGLLFVEMLIFNPRSGGNISSQGNWPTCPGNLSGVSGGPGSLCGDPGNVYIDIRKDSTDPENV